MQLLDDFNRHRRCLTLHKDTSVVPTAMVSNHICCLGAMNELWSRGWLQL